MANFFKKLIGTKSDRDLKALNPILRDIKKAYTTITDLSADELRAKTVGFRAYLNENTKEYTDKINDIKAQLKADPEMPSRRKEALYDEIDKAYIMLTDN